MEIICKKKNSIPKITPPVAGENPCKGQDENSKWLEQFILMHETINLIYNEEVKFLRINFIYTWAESLMNLYMKTYGIKSFSNCFKINLARNRCIHASFFPLSCEEHPTFGLTVMKLKMLSPFWSELNSVNALLVLLCKRTFYFHYLLQLHMNTELSTFGQRVQYSTTEFQLKRSKIN